MKTKKIIPAFSLLMIIGTSGYSQYGYDYDYGYESNYNVLTSEGNYRFYEDSIKFFKLKSVSNTVSKFKKGASEGNPYLSAVTEYDQEGRNVLQTTYQSDGSIDSRTSYIYDSFGNLLESSYSSETYSSGNYKTTYKYNKDHKVIETKQFNNTGKQTSVATTSYDKKGNVVLSVTKGEGYNSKYKYVYDDKNRVTGSEYYGNDKKLASKSTTTYDADGKVIEYDYMDNSYSNTTSKSFYSYYPDGTYASVLTIINDKEGKLTGKQSTIYNTKGFSIAYTNYDFKNRKNYSKNISIYKDDTQLIESYDYYGDSLSIVSRTTYKYNEKGLNTEYATYDENEELRSISTKKYDSFDRVIESSDEYKVEGSCSNYTRETTTYDLRGNRTEVGTYNQDNSLRERVTGKYNDKGFLIETSEFNSKNELKKVIQLNYEYFQ
jgi:hypothetical protein